MPTNPKNPLADSAGRLWQGRSFESNQFQNDDGSAAPEFLEIMKALRAGEAKATEVLEVLKVSRLLIPLVALLGELGSGEKGLSADKSAELSIVTVKAPDDQDALVAFSSVETMSNWNAQARPVPTDLRRISLAAASQLATRLVIDPGSETEFVIRRPAIEKLAQGMQWEAPETQISVCQVISNSILQEPLVTDFKVESGDPESRLAGPELLVTFAIEAGLNEQEVSGLVQRISQSWAADKDFARAVDSVAIKIIPSSPDR